MPSTVLQRVPARALARPAVHSPPSKEDKYLISTHPLVCDNTNPTSLTPRSSTSK